MANKHDEKRARDVGRVAREVFGIEIDMEHRDSVRSVSAAELRRALEAAYDLGRKAALS